MLYSGKIPKLDFINVKLRGRLLFSKYFLTVLIDTASSLSNVCTTDCEQKVFTIIECSVNLSTPSR